MTIVGGKLTTYRRMAEDAVDAAVAHAGLTRRSLRHRSRCRCSGAARAPGSPSSRAGRDPGYARWYAASAPTPPSSSTPRARSPGSPTRSCSPPIDPTIPVTLAELVFGVTHEGAADVADLLDRRTRVGLIPADRAVAVPAAERALGLARARTL